MNFFRHFIYYQNPKQKSSITFLSIFSVIVIVIVPITAATLVTVISWAKVFTVFATAKFLTDIFNAVLYERTAIKLKFSIGNRRKFGLNIIIMNQFPVPVAVSKFHVVRDGIRKTLAFFGVFLA